MPCNMRDYPSNWFHLKAEVRARSQGVCECRGECGEHTAKRCTERHQCPATHFAGAVALAAAHLCNDGPACAKTSHLKDMCQRCHLLFDMERHLAKRKRKAIANAPKTLPLFPRSPNTPTEG